MDQIDNFNSQAAPKLGVRLKPMFIAIGLALALVAALWLYTPDRTRDGLEARYLHQARDMVTIGPYRLHLRDEGPRDGEVLVLVHGFAASLHCYEDWARDLSRDYRVISFDLPGQGLSDPDPDHDYSIKQSVRVISTVLDQLGLKNIVLVGHSMGGQMAWNLAGDQTIPYSQQRISRLVLIAPAGYPSPDQPYDTALNLPSYLAIVKWVMPRFLISQGLKSAFGDPDRVQEPMIDRFWDLLRAPGNRQATIERLSRYLIHDPAATLRQIKVPTLILWGRKDQFVPVENAIDYAREISTAQVKIYDGVGHVPMEEIPDATLLDLRQFLAQTKAGPPLSAPQLGPATAQSGKQDSPRE